MENFVWCFTLFLLVLSDCDINNIGTTECIQILRYDNMFQWGTCLTDEYMQAKTSQKWQCEDRSATYCYFQCMAEVHNVNNGAVSEDCLCQKGDEHIANNLPLPSKCYSPNGTDCTWYRDCLEKKYKCEGTKDDYAIEYATKFCELYSQGYHSFSLEGKAWIEVVRKCLQVSLVPILRPWRTATCKEIREIAFKSHASCYVQPNENLPSISICNLGNMDFLRVFWTIKSSLVMSIKSMRETITGYWETRKSCKANGVNNIANLKYDGSMRNLRLTVHYSSSYDQISSTNFQEIDQRMSDLGFEMADSIADKLNWDNQGILWFAEDSSLSGNLTSNMFINIFLADRATFDVNAHNSQSSNLTTIINYFQSHVENGDLAITNKDFSFSVLGAIGCSDANCKTLLFDVETKPKQKETIHADDNTKTYIIVGICSVVCLVILALGLSICCSHWKHGFGKGIV